MILRADENQAENSACKEHHRAKQSDDAHGIFYMIPDPLQRASIAHRMHRTASQNMCLVYYDKHRGDTSVEHYAEILAKIMRKLWAGSMKIRAKLKTKFAKSVTELNSLMTLMEICDIVPSPLQRATAHLSRNYL